MTHSGERSEAYVWRSDGPCCRNYQGWEHRPHPAQGPCLTYKEAEAQVGTAGLGSRWGMTISGDDKYPGLHETRY